MNRNQAKLLCLRARNMHPLIHDMHVRLVGILNALGVKYDENYMKCLGINLPAPVSCGSEQ